MSQVQVFDLLAPIAQVCRTCNVTTMTEAYISAVRQFCRKSRWYESRLVGSTTAPFITPYTTGTVTVTNLSAAVVGAGTSWLAEVAAGDTFTGPDAVEMEVESVTSDTALVLTSTYAGGTLAGQAYSIGRNRYVSTYNLGSDAYDEIIGVRAVQIEQSATNKYGLIDQSSTTYDPNEPAAAPEFFQYVPEAQLTVYPKPDAAYPLVMNLILQPKLGVNSIEESLIVKWDRAFRAGALSDLQRIHGMPWTDPNAAARNDAEFRDWMNRGTSAAEKRYAVPVTPW